MRIRPGKKPFSLNFSCKMPADHWTFAVYQYTITSCVRDLSRVLSQIHGRTPGPPDRGSPVPVTSRPWWPVWPPKAGTLSFTLTPCLFRSPSAHPLCFPRLFRVHPARRRQGPIWRVYLQGLTRFRMISIRSRWRSSQNCGKPAFDKRHFATGTPWRNRIKVGVRETRMRLGNKLQKHKPNYVSRRRYNT